jgi:hypothetical protein
MILNPSVIALLTGAASVTLMTVYAAFHGSRILAGWDLESGSELQLALEKKTYLVSTLMAYALAFQIISFFLFVFTADDLNRLFVGAMCAAGTLNVNAYGYPVVVLKIVNCLLAGVWLVLNYTDNRAVDYPLIKKKYVLLLAITPFVLGEAVLQGAYFLNLKANVITSCCGSLFSAEEQGFAAGLSALPPVPMAAAFFGIMALTLASGAYFFFKGKGAALFSFSAATALPVSVAALISFISLYFYELPTHHCPFCILQGEYHYAGYLIYVTLIGGGIAGTSMGALVPFRTVPSLKQVVPRIQRSLTKTALAFYSVLTVAVIARILFTDFVLTGY